MCEVHTGLQKKCGFYFSQFLFFAVLILLITVTGHDLDSALYGILFATYFCVGAGQWLLLVVEGGEEGGKACLMKCGDGGGVSVRAYADTKDILV